MTFNKVRSFYSKAPTRIDFAGGWTDLPEFAVDNEGIVVNAGINLCVHIELSLSDKYENLNIHCITTDETVYHSDEPTNLVQCIMKNAICDQKYNGLLHSDVPLGSGLGASGALGVALTSALKGSISDSNMHLAYQSERQMGISCGMQDHLAAYHGKLSKYTLRENSSDASPINLSSSAKDILEETLLLAYTGKGHSSGEILSGVIDSYRSGSEVVKESLQGLRNTAEAMAEDLSKNVIANFGDLLDDNWAYQKQLHPSITTDEIDDIISLSKSSGARGAKACGAGGGGCVVIYCGVGTVENVRNSLEAKGVDIMPVNFADTGVTIDER